MHDLSENVSSFTLTFHEFCISFCRFSSLYTQSLINYFYQHKINEMRKTLFLQLQGLNNQLSVLNLKLFYFWNLSFKNIVYILLQSKVPLVSPSIPGTSIMWYHSQSSKGYYLMRFIPGLFFLSLIFKKLYKDFSIYINLIFSTNNSIL